MTSDRLIFVLGVSSRVGTNYVRDLLALHPDCTVSPVDEDYIVAESDPLMDYLERLRGAPRMAYHIADVQKALRNAFVSLLGEGAGAEGRVLCKTPSTRNLNRYPALFPGAHVIVVVRDGRDTVASLMKTFGYTLERAARQWADGVDRLEKAAIPVHIVYYETVLRDLRSTLEALGLHPDAFPLDALDTVPLRGSSRYNLSDGQVNWTPQERPKDFQPGGAWESWHAHERRAFVRIAGEAMLRAGYSLQGFV